MAKNTSILLGDYFESFINAQIQSGKYSSASEVIRAALRLFEHIENRRTVMLKDVENGEKVGLVEDFKQQKLTKTRPRADWEKAFKKMHENGDDTLIIDDLLDDENLETWN